MDIVRKVFVGAREMLSYGLPSLGGSWLTAFFAAGLLVSFVQPIRGRLRWFTVGALGALAIAHSSPGLISRPMFPRFIRRTSLS